eukprot:TRINITY_DN17260_c0_g2_i1.p1 TRINITY_DN17260_c0_g2~~TRINITY_DN17260_c0_g2_i1.p1  ORF type:complete len:404 (+),score=72.35 TRINITY_DN17260_c0_g2_i1:72-1283(+)
MFAVAFASAFVLLPVAVKAGNAFPLSTDSISAAADHAEGPHEAFRDYISQFSRDYTHDTQEVGKRWGFFQERLALIQVQNAKAKRLWNAGLNAFTDRTDAELKSLRGWRRVGGGVHSGVSLLETSTEVKTSRVALDAVSWQNLSMASNVLDQGNCGSCWAVATVTMLQGRFESFGRGKRDFSVQQLVDCVPNPKACGGTGGCQGATVELAMSYVERFGLASSSKTPYTATDGVCQDAATQAPSLTTSFLALAALRSQEALDLNLAGWYKLPENKALPLMLAVASGPVAVSVAAKDWFVYSDGIFDGCPKDSVVDHAVTLFGYGEGKSGGEIGQSYWLVRNSWGGSWGEGGFIRLHRKSTPEAEQAHCGIDNDPSAGVACKPYPKNVEVCGMCGILYDSVAATF